MHAVRWPRSSSAPAIRPPAARRLILAAAVGVLGLALIVALALGTAGRPAAMEEQLLAPFRWGPGTGSSTG